MSASLAYQASLFSNLDPLVARALQHSNMPRPSSPWFPPVADPRAPIKVVFRAGDGIANVPTSILPVIKPPAPPPPVDLGWRAPSVGGA